VWDTRYRPLVFSDVLGQEGSVRVLRSRLKKDEAFNTSYIFAGGHGSGKTTLARILARAMLCQQLLPDGDPCNVCDHCQACLSETMVAFTELDAASQGTTSDMRQLVEHLSYDVPGVKRRIYLLDEAHRMSRDAQDVLLKPIEDKRVVVLFCTTEFGTIRDTISSRCEVQEIRKIQKEDILTRVQLILNKEAVEYQDDAVLMVIDHARGHVRDVLNQLETIAQLGPITVEAVRERLGLALVPLFYDILLALGSPAQAIPLLDTACERLSAPQVATGLAEAAMNSFRHANGIHTDFSQLDHQRAALVFSRFGNHVTDVARYFLGLGSYVTRLDLICAAVAFTGSGSAPLPSPAAVPPVVVVSAPLGIGAQSVAVVAPHQPSVQAHSLVAGEVSPAVAKEPPTQDVPVVPQAVVPLAAAPAATSGPRKPYVDYVPEAAYEEEVGKLTGPVAKGGGHSNPGPSAKALKPVPGPRGGTESAAITPEDFTPIFYEYLKGATSYGK